MVPPLVVGGAGALSALLVRGPLPAFPYVTNPLGVDGAVPDVLAAMGHHELWPAALIPPAAWLLVVARSEPSAGRRRVLRRVGVVAPLPSLGILVLTEAGAGEWAWVVTLLYALLLVDVTLFAARRERLWGMPALVHRTVLWVALSALAATASALVLYSEAQAGLQGPLQLAVGLGLAFGLASTAHAALAARLRRCLIGEGGDTLRALARLEDQLQHAEAGRPAPEVLAEAAASAVRGSVAVVDVLVSGRRRRVAGPDAPLEERLTLPIVHAGQAVGFLTLGLGDGEVLGVPERELLEELAAAAAPAVDAARLQLELLEQHELSDSLAALERERVARVLEDRLVTRLESLSADLDGVDGLAEPHGLRRLALAYDATTEMVDDVRALAHALARQDGTPAA